MSTAAAQSHDAGWSAYLKLGFEVRREATVLARRERFGPLGVQRPFYPEGEVCHVYLLHPPGGVAGGDQLQIDTDLQPGSQALITAPGATKFYRSAGALAEQNQQLTIADGASLEWLPHENIYFPDARVTMRTRIDLQGSARLAWRETHCLGRPVIEESFGDGILDSRLELWRDGKPLLIERLRVDRKSRERLSVLNSKPVTAMALFSPATEAHLLVARAVMSALKDPHIGATLLDDLLVVRYLGESSEEATRIISKIWSNLREPLFGRPAAVPRIWNT